jgi:hypothetical protein
VLQARLSAVEFFTSIGVILMRQFLGRILTSAILVGFGIGVTGCTDETGTKEEVKVTTPGGTSKETHEVKIQKSGENPPVTPSEKRVP